MLHSVQVVLACMHLQPLFVLPGMSLIDVSPQACAHVCQMLHIICDVLTA